MVGFPHRIARQAAKVLLLIAFTGPHLLQRGQMNFCLTQFRLGVSGSARPPGDLYGSACAQDKPNSDGDEPKKAADGPEPVEVRLADDSRRLFDLTHPDEGRPTTHDLPALEYDSGGEPTPDSLLSALKEFSAEVLDVISRIDERSFIYRDEIAMVRGPIPQNVGPRETQIMIPLVRLGI